MAELHHTESVRVAATLLTFNAIDKSDAQQYVARLAIEIDNTVTREDPFYIEWVGADMKMSPWVDEKTLQTIFKGELAVPQRDFEMTYAFNRKRIQDANSLERIAPTAEMLGNNWAEDRLGLVLEVFRQNHKAYDGKPFFHDAHKHTDGKTVYSNLLQSVWADPQRPTLAEAASDLRAAMSRLVKNRAVRRQVVSAEALRQSMVVIAGGFEVFEVLDLLRTQEKINNTENDLRGAFELWVDLQSPNPSSFITVYSAVSPGAPGERITSSNRALRGLRPVILVAKEEPTEVLVGNVDMTKKTVPIGLEGSYGVTSGWPQTAVLVEPAGGG